MLTFLFVTHEYLGKTLWYHAHVLSRLKPPSAPILVFVGALSFWFEFQPFFEQPFLPPLQNPTQAAKDLQATSF